MKSEPWSAAEHHQHGEKAKSRLSKMWQGRGPLQPPREWKDGCAAQTAPAKPHGLSSVLVISMPQYPMKRGKKKKTQEMTMRSIPRRAISCHMRTYLILLWSHCSLLIQCRPEAHIQTVGWGGSGTQGSSSMQAISHHLSMDVSSLSKNIKFSGTKNGNFSYY